MFRGSKCIISARRGAGAISSKARTATSKRDARFARLAHVSIAALGDQAWSLRLPATLFGVVTIPALYFLAREFAGRTEALFGCLLLTVSYHHVWFSQNARGYTLLAFLAVLSTA